MQSFMQLFSAFGKFFGTLSVLLWGFTAQNFALEPRVSINSDNGFRQVTRLKNGNTCTEKPKAQHRQALVDNLVDVWAEFGHQVYDLSSRQTHSFPGGDTFSIAPEGMNPWQSPKIIPRLLRVGRWEDNRRTDVAIGSFWSTLPKGELFLNRQNAIWAVNDNAGWADAWSAAFISWSFCESGIVMDKFLRHQSHYMYVDDALRGESPLYKAADIEDASIPKLGDMICADRSKNNTYQTLSDRKPHIGQARPLHCDIVVQHDVANQRIFAIGGNVGNSVTMTVLRLKNGMLERTPFRPWFTVLQWQGGGKANFETALKRAQK